AGADRDGPVLLIGSGVPMAAIDRLHCLLSSTRTRFAITRSTARGASVARLSAHRAGANGHTSGTGRSIARAIFRATCAADWRTSPEIFAMRPPPERAAAASPNSVSVPTG